MVLLEKRPRKVVFRRTTSALTYNRAPSLITKGA